jgi:hypothetical protein
MQYIPSGVMYASDIERGEFICYEIKSSYEDLYSGHGLNFYGDKNYIVTTMELGNRIYEDLDNGKLLSYITEHYPESSLNFGVMVIIPAKINKRDSGELLKEKNNPTPLDSCDQWQIVTLKPCYSGVRKRGVIELLFCILRAKHSATNRENDMKDILFLCDRKKCGENHDCGDCKHTRYVEHAANFYPYNDSYFEIEPNKDPEV